MSELPKILVISPKEMAERRAGAKEHLWSVGLQPTFFSGIYGKDMELRTLHGQELTVPLTPGRIALGLNHWFLWQHILLAELPSAIIFEDDVQLPPDFIQWWHHCMAQTPSDWDLIYMSLLYPERMRDGRIGAVHVNGEVWRHTQANSVDGACDGLHAYMISLRGMEKLKEVRWRLTDHFDRWISFNVLPLMNVYIWYPSVIAQRKSGLAAGVWKSTIGD